MPLLEFDGTAAYQNLRVNRERTWPTREGDIPTRVDPLCEPAFRPTFRIEQTDRIFTIGSCFARHVEQALHARGLQVLTIKIPQGDESFARLGTNVLNNYAVPAILNELEWALCPDKPYDPD